jgi:SAM-dependent methyltransferase
MVTPPDERNDAIKLGIGNAVERYEWAAEQLEKRLMWENSGPLIADVGCGLGYGVKILTDRLGDAPVVEPVPQVVGFDISRVALEYAEQYYPAPFVVCNVELQTFSGWDAVVCLEAFSHFIDPYTWLKNLDVPHVIVSQPIIKSRDVYPWRKHEIPPDDFRSMFVPKWKIVDELVQRHYMTVYARA